MTAWRGTECLTCGHDRTVNYFTVSFEVNETEYGMVTPVQAVSRVPEGANLTVSGSTVTVKGRDGGRGGQCQHRPVHLRLREVEHA